jgi:DNA-binding NarL/FixJ family response regulator
VIAQAAPPCGHPDLAVDVIDQASAHLDGHRELDYGYASDALSPHRAQAFWWAWRLDDADAALEAALAYATEHDLATLWNIWITGLLAMARGRLRDAARVFADATTQLDHVFPDPDSAGDVRSVLWSTLSEAAALAGDRATAERALAIAERVWPVDMLVPYREPARVWAAVVRGDIADARQHAIDGAARARDLGVHLLEARLLHDLVRVGDPDPAAPRLAELSETIAAAPPALCAAHARGLADGDADAVQRAAESFEAAGLLLLAAEAHAQRAKLLHDQGRGAAAMSAQLAAHRLVDRCDGASTPALTLVAAPALTEREREVALLAARGLRDRQIAERLGVSTRTVSSHLHRCYTKLGIRRRTELRDVLG